MLDRTKKGVISQELNSVDLWRKPFDKRCEKGNNKPTPPLGYSERKGQRYQAALTRKSRDNEAQPSLAQSPSGQKLTVAPNK